MGSIVCKLVWLFKTFIELCYYFLAAYGLIVLLYWWSDNTLPIKIIVGSINKTVVRPNEVAVFDQHIQKFRVCPGEVYRYIRGDCGFYDVPPIAAALKEGTHSVRIPVQIPSNFQTGSCYFFSIHKFKCNPLDFIFDRRNIVSDPISFFVEANR